MSLIRSLLDIFIARNGSNETHLQPVGQQKACVFVQNQLAACHWKSLMYMSRVTNPNFGQINIKSAFSMLKILIAHIFYVSAIDCSWLPKIVWSLWESPIQSAPMIRMFHQNHQHMLAEKGWELRLLTSSTMDHYLSKAGFKGFPKNPVFDAAMARSDLIRLYLLKEYGGVWLDVSAILTDNFDWLENLASEPAIQNNFGTEPEFFAFHKPNYGSPQRRIHPVTKLSVLISPGLEPWFMATKPHSKLITEWAKLYEEYMQIGVSEFCFEEKLYKDRQYITKVTVEQNIEVRGIDKLDDYLDISKIPQIILQRRQRQLDKQSTDKYAVEQYGLWTLNCQLGPLNTNNPSVDIREPVEYARYLAQTPIQTLRLKEQYPKYFIKLIGPSRRNLQAFIFRNHYTESQQFQLQIFKQFCTSNLYIEPNSIVSVFLISPSQSILSQLPQLQPIRASDELQLRKCNQIISLSVLFIVYKLQWTILVLLFLGGSFLIYRSFKRNEYKMIDLKNVLQQWSSGPTRMKNDRLRVQICYLNNRRFNRMRQ